MFTLSHFMAIAMGQQESSQHGGRIEKRWNTVSHRITGDQLKEKGFSLQATRKTYESKGHKDRDAQFEFINQKVKAFFLENQPVISVDAQKRELVGVFKNDVRTGIQKELRLK